MISYKVKSGLRVIDSGPVIINGVKHRVKNGFVVCHSGLNSMAWNTTKQSSVCDKCFQEKQLAFGF